MYNVLLCLGGVVYVEFDFLVFVCVVWDCFEFECVGFGYVCM